jgi:hypothetical protein
MAAFAGAVSRGLAAGVVISAGFQSMVRKSGYRFSEKIMLEQ